MVTVYLGRVVIVELYDDAALLAESVNGRMAWRRASNHGGVEGHTGRHDAEEGSVPCCFTVMTGCSFRKEVDFCLYLRTSKM